MVIYETICHGVNEGDGRIHVNKNRTQYKDNQGFHIKKGNTKLSH